MRDFDIFGKTGPYSGFIGIVDLKSKTYRLLSTRTECLETMTLLRQKQDKIIDFKFVRLVTLTSEDHWW